MLQLINLQFKISEMIFFRMNGLIRQSYNQKLRRLSWFSKKINPLLFVPQQEVYLIERFGAYSRQKGGGPLFKIPLIETVSGVQGEKFKLKSA